MRWCAWHSQSSGIPGRGAHRAPVAVAPACTGTQGHCRSPASPTSEHKETLQVEQWITDASSRLKGADNTMHSVPPRDALEGKGPQRRLDRQLEEVAKAVGGGYCWLQMPLRLALAVRGTVAGRRLGALEGGGGTSHGTVHVVRRCEILAQGGRLVGQEGVRDMGTQERQPTGEGATQTHRTREPHQEGQGRTQQTRRRGTARQERQPEQREQRTRMERMVEREHGRQRQVSRSPDGLFAQQEREPIRGRPAVRGTRTYGGRPGQRVEEQGTWASQKHSEAGYGRPVDKGVWTAKTVKRPRQQPAHPQYTNYWAPLTRKRHIPPHSAQPRHTNYWAPQTRKRHQREHRPQRPTERSDPTQHAKGRTGDSPGPRKGATTRWNVTQGGTSPPSNASLVPPLPEQRPCQSNSRWLFRNFWNRVLFCPSYRRPPYQSNGRCCFRQILGF